MRSAGLLVRVTACALLAGCGSSSSSPDGGGPAAEGLPPSSCPAPAGAGVKHGGDTVTADTTWRAADNPHTVTFGFTVAKGATLTLEPCVDVRVAGVYGITVEGRLVAEGTATQPIHVGPTDPAKPWSYIRTFGGEVRLAYVTLENGGNAADPNGLGVLDARNQGSGAPPGRQELLRVDHVTIKGSDQYGVSLRSGATFTKDSTGLTISGARLGPIRTWPSLAGNIPPGTYSGNTVDDIIIVSEETMVDDTTLHDRGVPYRLGTGSTGWDLRVGAGSAGAARTTLTIEPGVTIRVTPKGRIFMSSAGTPKISSGVLVAVGTAAKPIVFTSAASTPAAGDWVGLWFDITPDPASRLDHVRVEHAGGPSLAKSFHCDLKGGLNEEEDASILVFGPPPTAFITNSTISSSAGYGIGRAWSGDLVDLIANNTFQGIARCKQSYPRDAKGGCPTSVPCP